MIGNIMWNYDETWKLGKTDDTLEVRAAKLAKARADIELICQRVTDMGFNLWRAWDGAAMTQGGAFDGLGANGTEPAKFVMGDGSRADVFAYLMWRMDVHGVKIWESSNNIVGTVQASDVDVINDPATAAAWKAGLEEWQKNWNAPQGLGIRNLIARAWDPRIEALAQSRMKRFADFRNPYKNNLRWGDDPQVVTWELSNEEIWIKPMINGDWRGLPKFFRDQLLSKWNDYLVKKYGDDAKLTAAWKSLLPGESLQTNTIQLLPMAGKSKSIFGIPDTNPEAYKKLTGAADFNGFGREDFARARGADVLEFFTGMWLDYKKREETQLESWGKGCRLVPTILDSYNPYQIQTQYLQQNADVVSTCAYVKGMGHDPTDKRFPFYAATDEYPRLTWDIPWIEQSKIPNKPLFIYENQIDNRTKYRADYPLRLATGLSIQDADIVNWHTYDGLSADLTKDKPFDGMLHIWADNLGYGHDEVQISAMRAAGAMFVNFSIPPAPKPTLFTFGRRSLYDPNSMDYGQSFGDLGRQIMPTLYRYGAQVLIDPTRQDDKVEGPTVKLGIYNSNPLQPNDAISYDWHKSDLTIDTPSAMAYTGFFANRDGLYRWKNGLQLRKVEVVNPEGIAYPVTPAEKYIEFSIVAQDGKPLAQSKKALISLVSTSFNSGYSLNLNRPYSSNRDKADGPLQEYFGAQEKEAGKAPVLVARVGGVIEGAALNGFRYTLRDFSMRKIGGGTIANNQLVVDASLPIFLIELER